MTPEQTKSAYQLVCEQECEWCAKGSEPIDGCGPLKFADGKIRHSTPIGNTEMPLCTAPSKEVFMERQAAQIAAMQAALAKIPHAEHCESQGDNKAPHAGTWMPHREPMPERCNCYLSTLSDDIERGKELLGAVEAKEKAERELRNVNGCWSACRERANKNHEAALGFQDRALRAEVDRDEARATSQRLQAQYDALDAAYEQACKSLASSCARAEFSEGEVQRQAVEIEELRRDKARLDWVEANRSDVECCERVKGNIRWEVEQQAPHWATAKTLREAIDAAMKEND